MTTNGGEEGRGACRKPPQAVGPIRAFCDEYTHGLGSAYTFTFYASLVALALGAMMPGWPGKVVQRAKGTAEAGAGH